MRQIPPDARSNQPINILIAVAIACCIAAGIFYVVRHQARLVVEQMLVGKDLQSPGALATELYGRGGKKIGEFAGESRYFVGIDMMPTHLLQAFVAAEDAGFSSHNGISLAAIARAAWTNLIRGEIVQGGSTITQQLARMSFLNNQQTLQRKFREAVVAITLESLLTKRRILELYLNRIFLGNHSYGVEAASRNYFRKSVTDLNVAESALLAGLPAAPSSYAPHRHWDKAKTRQKIVLRRMVEEGFIKENARRYWENYKVRIEPNAAPQNSVAPYFVGEVKSQMKKMFELNDLDTQGLKILTTLDVSLQNHVRRHLAAAVSKHFAEERKGAFTKHLRAAMLILDTKTGAVLAMQGGTSYQQTKFNHSMHALRPLGTLFMPVYYALALERGFSMLSSLYTQGERIESQGIVRRNADLSLFEGLVGAKSVESSRLVAWLGVGTVAQQASVFGLTTQREDLSLALGRNRASLWQITGAYTAFFNNGKKVSPYVISRVLDKEDKELFSHRSEQLEVTGQEAAFIIRDSLRAATKVGAARGGELAQTDVFGYVGTDRSLHDAWYVGAVGPWLVGLWVGSDKGTHKLKQTTDELEEAVGLTWAEIVGPIAPLSNDSLIPPASVSYTRLKFDRDNLGTLSVPFRTRHASRKF